MSDLPSLTPLPPQPAPVPVPLPIPKQHSVELPQAVLQPLGQPPPPVQLAQPETVQPIPVVQPLPEPIAQPIPQVVPHPISQPVQGTLDPVQQPLQQYDTYTQAAPPPQQVLQPQTAPAPAPRPAKKQRRRYDNNFKAEVLEHLKVPGTRLPAVAKQYGIPENTLREWTKVSVVQSIEAARQKHGGTLKANMYDPMNRLTEALMVFFDRNERQPQHQKQPVTTKLVVAKGLEAKNNLLELHEIQPFLDPKEKKALEAFTGSDSWAKKFAKRHDLKMTGARVKELGDEDVRTYSVQLRQMASRVKQAGPAYEEVSTMLRQAAEKLVAARIVVSRRSG